MRAQRQHRRVLHPFEVLSDPVRLDLVRLLFVGEQTSGDVATMMYDRFGIGWPSVSEHLGILRDSGFVDVLPEGPRRWYFLRESWLDLLREAVDDLDGERQHHAADRELGFVLPSSPPACGAESSSPPSPRCRPHRRGEVDGGGSDATRAPAASAAATTPTTPTAAAASSDEAAATSRPPSGDDRPDV